MAFQIRCPSCGKLYAAEERMVGRKMRCKSCGSVFAIEAASDEPSLSAASIVGVESHTLGPSDLTGTRRAIDVPSPSQRPPDVDEAPLAEEKPFLRPSVPQGFPMSHVVEAWLPLVLGLISAVWVIAQTFGSNETGRSWVPLLRIAVVGLLYIGLVVPLTYKMVRANFRQMRRILPPNSGMRTLTTFALPAAFGYEMWQASGGVGGFFAGMLMGLALTATAYWLLFRLTPQEAANSYAKVGGTFMAGCGLSALIVVGASAALNRSMISEHAGDAFKESPLGAPLSWNTEEPKPRPVSGPSDMQVAGPETPPAPQPSKPTPPPRENEQIAKNTETVPPVKSNDIVVTEPPGEQVSNPPRKPDVFVNPDDDSFTDSIRKNNFPWVKSISRGDGASSFDFTVSSSGQSQFVGLVASDGKFGRKIMIAPLSAALPPIQDDLDQVNTFCSRYLLSADGKALIHLTSRNQIEVIATGENRRDLIPIEMPNSKAQLKPALVGVMKDNSVVVRWAAPEANEQYVYRYDYLTKVKLSRAWIQKETFTTPVAFAVGTNTNGPAFYAWLSQAPARAPQVRMINLTSARQSDTRIAVFPQDIADVTLYERAEICFSPDGSKLAMVLEQGDTARVLAWPATNPNINLPVVKLTCKAPTSTEMAGIVRGPTVRWINNAVFAVYGRTLIQTVKGGIIGNLTDSVVTGEQTTPDNKMYVSYMLPDTHLHLATIEFDPVLLNKAPLVSAATH